jgi:hypothetical protein
MKKTILISGIICLNIFVIGAFLKVFHFPGANIGIFAGMVSFALWFLPIAFIYSYKSSDKSKKPLYIVGFICTATCILGALCKIMHLPGSNLFLLIGIPLPFILFLPMYLYFQRKEKNKSVINFAKIMFLMIFIAVVNSLLTFRINGNIVKGYTNDLESAFKSSEIEMFKNKTLLENFPRTDDSIKNTSVAEITKRSDDICITVNRIQTTVINEFAENQVSSANEIMNNEWEKVRIVASSSIIFGFKDRPDLTLGLKKSINDYCEFIKNLPFVGKEQSEQISLLLNTSDKVDMGEDGKTISWENWLFKNRYLITVITNLEDVKAKVRLAENTVLEAINKKDLTVKYAEKI